MFMRSPYKVRRDWTFELEDRVEKFYDLTESSDQVGAIKVAFDIDAQVAACFDEDSPRQLHLSRSEIANAYQFWKDTRQGAGLLLGDAPKSHVHAVLQAGWQKHLAESPELVYRSTLSDAFSAPEYVSPHPLNRTLSEMSPEVSL